MLDRIEARLTEIERRLAALERGATPPFSPRDLRTTPPNELTLGESRERVGAEALEATPNTSPGIAAPGPVPTRQVPSVHELEQEARRRAAALSYQRMRERQSAARPEFPKIDWAKLESLIAGRWYALVGGLVVTIGVALFVQFAYKQGWLEQIPGSVRCVMGAGLGVVLLGGGEWARRKVNEWASVGLTIAGLGSLYASSYAAYALYKLMDPGATLLVLAAVAAIGVVISAITSLSVVGLVSLIGAYLAPLIASEGHTGYVYLPPYWLGLLIVGNGLGTWKGGTFALCRWLVTLATMGFGTGWVFEFGDDAPRIGLAMLGASWALIHAETWWTAWRADGTASSERTEQNLHELLNDPIFYKKLFGLRLRPLTSISASVWAVLLGLEIARKTSVVPHSAVAGATALVAFIIASFMVGTHRVLNARPKTRVERLAAALCATSGTLLAATIAIALSGFSQVIALTALGLAALGAGRWLKTRVLDLYGGLVLLYAAGRVLLYDSWATAPDAPGVEIMGFYLTDWAAACAGVGAAWFVYAMILIWSRPHALETSDTPDASSVSEELFGGRAWNAIADFGLGLGLLLLGASLVHEKARHEAIACAAIGTALAMALSAAWRISNGLRIASLVALGTATVATVSLFWWSHSQGNFEFLGLMLRREMVIPLACACVAFLIAWLLSEASWAWANASKAVAGVGTALLVGAVSHQDSSPTALCVVWLAICWGIALASRPVRGLALPVHALFVWLTALLLWVDRFATNNWANAGGPALMYPGLWLALALAGTIVGLERVARPGVSPSLHRRSGLFAWWTCMVLVWTSTSLEVARIAGSLAIDSTSKGAAVSVWWGIFAIGLLAIGYWKHNAGARGVGLAILALGTAKAVFIDLAHVSAGWRAVSIVALGLLMVGVSVVYALLSRRVASNTPNPAPADAPEASPQVKAK